MAHLSCGGLSLNISKLFDNAKAAIMHSISNFAKLPEAHIQAEFHIAEFVEAIYRTQLDEEVENLYYNVLHPHYTDASTPWLSAWVHFFNQNNMAMADLSEDKLPDPLSPSAMVG
ncbi:hypothetical protein L0F63_005071 [Massospora cicadina]|nr:hypothetical protein L0F63_005071 [Massospora cicadina]